jgi:uncharacterized membrane protein AbrB (regulator of aidB expression)
LEKSLKMICQKRFGHYLNLTFIVAMLVLLMEYCYGDVQNVKSNVLAAFMYLSSDLVVVITVVLSLIACVLFCFMLIS